MKNLTQKSLTFGVAIGLAVLAFAPADAWAQTQNDSNALWGEYYHNRNFTNQYLAQSDPFVAGAGAWAGSQPRDWMGSGIWFDWGPGGGVSPTASGSPFATTGGDNWSIRWRGTITIPGPGQLFFRVTSDDGTAFALSTGTPGGTPNLTTVDFINNIKNGTSTAVSANPPNYAGGEVLDLLLEYDEGGGDADVIFEWGPTATGPWTVVPPTAFDWVKLDDPAPIATTNGNLLPNMLTFASSGAPWPAGTIIRYTLDGTDPGPFPSFFGVGGTVHDPSTGPLDTTTFPLLPDGSTFRFGTLTARAYFGGYLSSEPVTINLSELFTEDQTAVQANWVPGTFWQYYTNTWGGNLPDFSTYVPEQRGLEDRFDLTLPRAYSTSIGGGENNFGVVFSAWIFIPTTDIYTFYTTSDDGSALWIGDLLPLPDTFPVTPPPPYKVVDNDGSHGMRERQGSIGLTQGYHMMSVTFSQGTGGKGLIVEIEGGGIGARREIVQGDLWALDMAQTPGILPGSGNFAGSQPVDITPNPLTGTVYQSTNGQPPDVTQTPAPTPGAVQVTVTNTTTVKAVATEPGLNPSATASETYTRTDIAPIPVTAIASGGTPPVTQVVVTFDKDLDPADAVVPGNYLINQQVVTVTPVILGPRTIRLTSPIAFSAGTTYTLDVSNLQEAVTFYPGPPPFVNGTIQFTYYSTGSIGWEKYGGSSEGVIINGNSVNNLTSHATYPDSPTDGQLFTLFEGPNGNDDRFGGRMQGYFYPPVSGDYVFAIYSDDNGRLSLSSAAGQEEDPNAAVQIATVPGWTGTRDWDKYLPEQQSLPVTLDATKRYYIEALYKEGGGGDRIGVLAVLNGTPISDGDAPIPGSQLSPLISGPQVVVPPLDQTVPAGTNVTMTVTVSGSGINRTFQWYKDGSPIGGATSQSLTLNNVTTADFGQYHVVVTNIAGQATSPTAQLIVNDSLPPSVVSVYPSTSGTELNVLFNELVEQTSAELLSNYTIDLGVVFNSATLQPDGRTVLLAMTGGQRVCTGITYTLTVDAVADLSVPAEVMGPQVIPFLPTGKPSQGMVASYPLDEGSGATATDTTGNGNTGTIAGGVSYFTPGKRGFGLAFPGTAGNNVSITTNPAPGAADTEYTSSLWFRTTDPNAGGLFGVNDTIVGPDRDIWIEGDQIYAILGFFSNETISTSAVPYRDGNWHHVLHTFGGVQGGQKLFIDGVQVATGGQNFTDVWREEMTIGSGFNQALVPVYFNGDIDEVRVFDRALTSAEIADLAHSNFAPSVDAGPDSQIPIGGLAALNGTSADDGLPSGTITYQWSVVENLASIPVVFADAASPNTTVSITGGAATDTIILELEAYDGEFYACDHLTLTVVTSTGVTVTGISPNIGPEDGSQAATITGTGFTASSTVTIGGNPAGVTFVSANQLDVSTPSGAGALVDVVVNVPTVGTDTLAGAYTYVPDPIVTPPLVPDIGDPNGGTIVTIMGNNFVAGQTVVTFDGNQATVVVVDAMTLSVVTPPGAGTVDVVVTTFNVVTSSATVVGGYTYAPVPVITSIIPNTGPTGASPPPGTVTIMGQNLTNANVTFGGVAGTIVDNTSATTLTVIPPTTGTPGFVDVVVTNAAGSTTVTNGYTYINGPVITSLTPDEGPEVGGQTVTINGTNFSGGGTTVTINGLNAPVVSSTPTSVEVLTPKGNQAGGNVTIVDGGTVVNVVVTVSGVDSAPASYTYWLPPVVQSINPISGPVAGGNAATITGLNFSSDPNALAQVYFGALATGGINFTVVNSTTISIPAAAPTPPPTGVPGQPSAGTRDVRVDMFGVSGIGVGLYTYGTVPIVQSLSVQTGPSSGGTQVIITGQNFVPGNQTVIIGAAPATITAEAGSTSITIDTGPSAPGTYDLVVTVGGTLQSDPSGAVNDFTYTGPAITAINPNSGSVLGGDTVVIEGTDFAGTTAVTFGGVNVLSFTLDTSVVPNTLTVTTPPGASAGSVDVVVVASSGTATATNGFTYLGASITSISPNQGPEGGLNSVTITGTLLSGATQVLFGTNAGTITGNDDTTIVVTVPAGTGIVTVEATVSAGLATATNAYTYLGVPTITGITPASGPLAGGQLVTITGTSFETTDTTVNFGATVIPPGSVTVIDSQNLQVLTPGPGAGTVNVSVLTGAGGPSAGSVPYDYIPFPVITNISPNIGPLAGGQVVTITATNLVDGLTTVTIDGVNASVGPVVTGTITAVTPPRASAAIVDVVVTTFGVQSDTATGGYTYADPPTITPPLSPNRGPIANSGYVVTINGTNFINGQTTVTFGAAAPVAATWVSANQITVVPPNVAAGTGTVNVTVTTPVNSATANSAYTFVDPPTFASVNPAQGPAAGGQSVTITGSNFEPGQTTVQFGASAFVPATVLPGNTQLTVNTPAQPAGMVDLTVRTFADAASQVTTASTPYEYLDAPAIATLTPNQGSTAGGDTVTIDGSGFVSGGTTVIFGGVDVTASVTFVTSAQITVVSPVHAAGAVSVQVTTAGGTSNSATFMYFDPPTILTISPAEGPVGLAPATVTITGTNFVSGQTDVTFGAAGTVAANVSSPTSLTVVPPTFGTPGFVNVTVATGFTPDAVQPNGYQYLAAPTIAPPLSPDTGSDQGGDTVTITGTNFSLVPGETTVTFGATTVAATVSTPTSLTVVTPPGPLGPVDVIVTTFAASSPPGLSSATLAGGYTYVQLSITSIVPNEGPTAGGQTVTITGTNFGATQGTVTIGGINAPVTSWNGATNTIVVTTPPGVAGPVDVVVQATVGQVTLAGGYTYLLNPTVTSILPNVGPTAGAWPVTITGTNFSTVLGETTVTIGGVPATGINVVNSTTINATADVFAGGTQTVDVVVTTFGTQQGTLPGGFTYYDPPTVTTFTPTQGANTGGTLVTVTGTNFVAGQTTATVAGVAVVAQITVVNSTTLQLTTAATAGTPIGPIVVTTFGTQTSPNSPTDYTYVDPSSLVDLSVTKGVDNATPSLGANVTFTVTVSNAAGGLPATGVQVEDLLPAGLTLVVANPSAGTYTPLPLGLWDVGNLAAGASETLQIVATVNQGGTITNVAEVTAQVENDVDSTPNNGNTLEDDYASVSVSADLTIQTASPLPDGTEGAFYSQTITALGGTQPYNWSLSGTLPTGLFLNAGTGEISGTPGVATAGTYNFTIQVTDSAAPSDSDSQAYSLTINPASGGLPVVNTTPAPPAGMVGVPYTYTFTATAGTPPYVNWTLVTGPLPPGLSFNTSTGVLSGTPTAAAGGNSYPIDLTVTDSNAQTSATETFTIDIQYNPVTITTVTLPDGQDGVLYNQTVDATGGIGPYTWALVGAPAFLGVGGSTGLTESITGTPGPADVGQHTFTVQVTDNGQGGAVVDTQVYTINILAAGGGVLTITTTTLPAGTLGQTTYNAQLTATGGTAPAVTWSEITNVLTGLGLTLNTGTGAITGTPNASGSFGVTIQVQDTVPSTDTQAYTLTIAPPPAITTPSPLTSGVENQLYPGVTLAATGGVGPMAWSIQGGVFAGGLWTGGGLSTGLTLNQASGQITGTPAGGTAGTANFTVDVTDVNGVVDSVAYSMTILVAGSALTVTTTTLPQANIGVFYSVQLQAAGGILPYTWTELTTQLAGTGLTLSTGGLISGTPVAAGTVNPNFQVSDSTTPTAQTATSGILTLDIVAPLAITTNGLPVGAINIPYAATLTASGVTPAGSANWQLTGGILPGGLTLTGGGVISGTPTTVEQQTFTVQVTDGLGRTQQRQYTLTILLNLPAVAAGSGGGGGGCIFGALSEQPAETARRTFWPVLLASGLILLAVARRLRRKPTR